MGLVKSAQQLSSPNLPALQDVNVYCMRSTGKSTPDAFDMWDDAFFQNEEGRTQAFNSNPEISVPSSGSVASQAENDTSSLGSNNFSEKFILWDVGSMRKRFDSDGQRFVPPGKSWVGVEPWYGIPYTYTKEGDGVVDDRSLSYCKDLFGDSKPGFQEYVVKDATH